MTVQRGGNQRRAGDSSAGAEGGQQPVPEPGSEQNEPVSPELLAVFSEEADDLTRSIYAGLATLQQNPHCQETVQVVRRAAHTLKGASGVVGLRRLTRLAHRMEDLLDRLFQNTAQISAETLKLLYATTDALQDLATGRDDPALEEQCRQLYAKFDQLMQDEPLPDAVQPLPTADQHSAKQRNDVQEPCPVAKTEPDAAVPPAASPKTPVARPSQFLRVPLERLDHLVRTAGEQMINLCAFDQRRLDLTRLVDELRESTDRLRQLSGDLESLGDLGGAPAWIPAKAGVRTTPRRANTTGGSGIAGRMPSRETRADPDPRKSYRDAHVHRLLKILGEATEDLAALRTDLQSWMAEFDGLLTKQGRLSRETQDGLMRVRMLPFSTLSTRIERAVRPLAEQEGKRVDVTIEGQHVELDKTVLEEMVDPLLHLLRNAVDHGIESPEERRANGKSERAKIVVRAFYRGTQVVIQVGDDGRGLDPDRLREVAVRRGLVAPAEAASLAPEELFQFIFQPGFSTAGQISEVSGRGVGMDVVRERVQKLKGTIDVGSTPGGGTTFSICLPMTLAVTKALLVSAAGELFAIPMQSVLKIVRISPGATDEFVQQSTVRLEGEEFPFVHLSDFLRLDGPTDRGPAVMVVNAGEQQIAVAVDRILASRDMIVKSLGNHLQSVPGFVGATLLGDGTVVPILDPVQLFHGWRPAEDAADDLPASQWRERLTVMLVDDSASVRRSMTHVVKMIGWKPLVARDGLEALEILQACGDPPDVIVLDQDLPRLEGPELLRALRSEESFQTTPIILVSSHSGEQPQTRGADRGVTAQLTKPYQADELIALIRRLTANVEVTV